MVKPPEPAIATDLVEYVVIVLPGPHALPAIARELSGVTASRAVRVLDLVVVTVDAQQHVELVDIDTIAELGEIRDSGASNLVLLSHHDIELVSLSLRAGECALVLVAEDRWALPLATAARKVGGGVRAGERIAQERVEFALERVTDHLKEG